MSSRSLAVWLAAAFVARVSVGWVFPFLGDEAYYLSWGLLPSLGFYDHPPMVGWFSAVAVRLGPFARLVPGVVAAFGVWLFWKLALAHLPRDRARVATAAFAVSPLALVGIFQLPDVYVQTAAIGLALAVTGRELRPVASHGLGVGALFGAALLSKFFAALLVPALDVFLWRVRSLKYTLAVCLGVLPAAVALWLWNRDHCFTHVMFYGGTRHEGAAFHWHDGVEFALTSLVLFSPFLLIALSRWPKSDRFRHLHLMWVVPFVVCFAVSFFLKSSAHWMLTFWPMMLVAGMRDCKWPRAVLGWQAVLGLGLAVLVLFVSVGPQAQVEGLLGSDRYKKFTRAKDARRIAAVVPGLPVFTSNYVASSELAVALGRPVGVIGLGSRFGRNADMIPSFRGLKDAVIVVASDAGEGDFIKPYFTELSTHSHPELGIQIIIARGFKPAAYAPVLGELSKTYYREGCCLPAGVCDNPKP